MSLRVWGFGEMEISLRSGEKGAAFFSVQGSVWEGCQGCCDMPSCACFSSRKPGAACLRSILCCSVWLSRLGELPNAKSVFSWKTMRIVRQSLGSLILEYFCWEIFIFSYVLVAAVSVFLPPAVCHSRVPVLCCALPRDL